MREHDAMGDAARWFVELMTAADVNQLWPRFEEWLRQGPNHRSAYEEIERAWSQCDRVHTFRSHRRASSDKFNLLH